MIDVDAGAKSSAGEDDTHRKPTTAGRSGRRSRLHRLGLIPRIVRRAGPKSLQARLTLGFASVVALSLLLVTVFVLNRLDDEFRTQEIADLQVRAQLVSEY
ncbi:MAG TPA: hypothetical protein VK194_00235, partial [Candidatus Deferrimicrobium sp.]|nr:hypothetical protein [Candidatus Deferrimicrobium sp.]